MRLASLKSSLQGQRWAASLLAAAALHVAVILWATSSRAPLWAAHRAAGVDTVELYDLDVAPPAPPALNEEPLPPASLVAQKPSPALRRPVAASPAAEELEPPNAGNQQPAMPGAGATPGSDEYGPLPPAPRAAGPLLINPPASPSRPLLPLALRAPRTALQGAPAPSSSVLSPGAQVVASVEKIVNGALAPRKGHTSLRFTFDANGTLTAVTATDSLWAPVASALQSAFSSRKLSLPSGARGATIIVAVDARVTNVPAALTGEVKTKPLTTEVGDKPNVDGQFRDSMDDYIRLPNTGTINPLALLPIERRVVSVELQSEQLP
jgi:hypothetical protein